MRTFYVNSVANAPVITEITANGLSNVSLLSGTATRYGGATIFSLTSANFTLTPSGCIVTVPSVNVTEANSPLEISLFYNGVEFADLNVVIGPVASAGATAVTAAALPLPSGAATDATLAALSAKQPVLGIAAPSASSPVTLPNDVTATGGASLSAVNTDLVTGTVNGWYDAANFHSVAVQVVGTAGISAGAVQFEQTNDTTAAPSGSVASVVESAVATADPFTGPVTIAASTARIFEAPITARYFRVRVSTAFTGGTVQAFAVFSQLPYAANRVSVRQGTGSNLNATVAQATAANLNATVAQPTAASLNATVVQATAASFNAQVVGSVAEDAASSANPVVVGGVVRTATGPTTLAAGDAARLTQTSGAQALVKPYGLPETDWQFTGILTTTTAAAAKAAGAAGIRNYVTDVSFQNTSATATTVLLVDGATTIAQWNAPANMAVPAVIQFVTPRRGTAATAMNVNCGTTAANILINVGGYQAP